MTSPWPPALANGWHPVAYPDEVGASPHPTQLMGRPIVLFRDGDGRLAALEDRCPHRNVPLSAGRVCAGTIQCPYHGWRFAADGACVEVPGSSTLPDARATALALREEAGLIWVSLSSAPGPFPVLPPEITDATLDSFWWHLDPRPARALDALENHLDPTHPHLLHPRLVRPVGARMPVPVTVTETPWGGEARYDESGITPPLLPRVIEGRRMATAGRFYAPLTGQVALENARGLSIAISVVFSPVAEGLTRPYAHFATPKGRLPARLKRWLIIAFNKPVLAQDAVMLADQARTIEGFGGPAFGIGPADLLGPIIWKRAHGKAAGSGVRTLTLHL